MAMVMGVIDAIRNIRGEMGFAPSEKVEVLIRADGHRPLLEAYGYYIRELARLSEIGYVTGEAPKRAALGIFKDVEVFVPITDSGVIDREKAQDRKGAVEGRGGDRPGLQQDKQQGLQGEGAGRDTGERRGQFRGAAAEAGEARCEQDDAGGASEGLMALNFSIVDRFVAEYGEAMHDRTLLRHDRYDILVSLRQTLWEALRDAERFEAELNRMLDSIDSAKDFDVLGNTMRPPSRA